MPLYLIAIGYGLKAVFAAGIDYWLAKKQKETPHTENTGGYVPMEEPNCRRRLCGHWVTYLQVLWTLFKIITPLYQLAIDSIQVQNSGTHRGWHRYQCYAQVFGNSPNMGSLFVLFGTAALKGGDEEKTETARCSLLGPFIVWFGAYMICPLVTHIAPFLGAYIWVNLLIVIGWCLIFFFVLLVIVEQVFHLDYNDGFQGEAAAKQLFTRSVGLVLVLVFALGTPTMIRLYGGNFSYMDSLWLSMSERTTHKFLYHEVQTAMEARNRWYSFIHFFI